MGIQGDSSEAWASSLKLEELLPCPFCGGTETQIRPNTYWTGMSSMVMSVDILHWCKEDNLKTILRIKGRTEDEAKMKWNSRAGTYS